MNKKELTDDQVSRLARGWIKGDKDSFSKLYDYFIDSIYKFIYFKVKDEDAEDLTELVFIKAWENRKKYKSKYGSFSSWLYTIARNTVIDHYRVTKEVYELNDYIPDDSEIADPQRITEDKLTSERLREAINKLPENYRDILLLRFIEDMEYNEIAEVLDKSEGAIRITQFRAIKSLREVLEKMGFSM
jgi:RNA polymerase sigma-70 factor (ECF subfamily)